MRLVHTNLILRTGLIVTGQQVTPFSHHSRGTLTKIAVKGTEAGACQAGIGGAIVVFELTTVSVVSRGTLADRVPVHLKALSVVFAGIQLTGIEEALAEFSSEPRGTGARQWLPWWVSASGPILTGGRQAEIQVVLAVRASESV